jgi:A/G-specific adenine glycosylase
MTARLRSSDRDELHDAVLDWFAHNARELPWRNDASAWAVMVSEFMLQQTPVSRVLPVFAVWTRRWPTPSALAAEPPGEAIRAWGRLGYPRRALRLHAAAVAIVAEHGGDVPSDHASLLALPGIGSYTAAAIASFAFGQRHVVLDTNVRRVFARVRDGVALPSPSLSASERETASQLLPGPPDASRWAAGTMELGAVVCTARSPRCEECPVRDLCRWRALGYPAYDGPKRPAQTYDGTDRQCRGRILQLLRDAHRPVAKAAIDRVWEQAGQRERALDGLVADGLIEPVGEDDFALPGSPR